MQHIYWFSYYNLDAPSTRYRGKYALEKLKNEEGISYTLIYPGYSPTLIIRFILCYFSVLLFRKQNSLICFQRIYSKGIYANALKFLLLFRKHNTVYDIDDAEYLLHDDSTIKYFMKNCAKCTVGSTALANYAGKYSDDVRIHTSPIIQHTKRKAERNKTLCVGWVGFYDSLDSDSEYSHKRSLEELFYPAFSQVNYPVKLVLMGVRRQQSKNELEVLFQSNPNITLDVPLKIDWQDEEAVYERIKEFDVGISALTENEMNEAKSAFKIKQYLSCGVPALASSTGENVKFIQHGINGILCDTADEFLDALNLINTMSISDYAELSGNAIHSTKRFTMQQYCSKLAHLAISSPAHIALAPQSY